MVESFADEIKNNFLVSVVEEEALKVKEEAFWAYP